MERKNLELEDPKNRGSEGEILILERKNLELEEGYFVETKERH